MYFGYSAVSYAIKYVYRLHMNASETQNILLDHQVQLAPHNAGMAMVSINK